LAELYDEGNYDFKYVSLVDDKCTHAAIRINQFNLSGFPTVYFDGGFQVKVGAYTSIPQQKNYFKPALAACENRPVKAIDVQLEVHWQGNATMDIEVTLTNNDPAPQDYKGILRVYVTELVSSLGWKDSGNKTYRFPFLDYALIKSVNLAQGATMTETATFVGANHNNGKGQHYGNISHDNIMVMAVLFNNTWHQGYSNPPNGNPFSAYYPDQSVGEMPATLWGAAKSIPEGGGSVNLYLSADEDNGNRDYMLFGSISGHEPGTPLPGGQTKLPLKWDIFTNVVINLANSPIFSNFLGTLGPDGKATATLNLPAVPGLAGITMSFAYALNKPWDFASNAADILITP
jgi:hypothetical protein